MAYCYVKLEFVLRLTAEVEILGKANTNSIVFMTFKSIYGIGPQKVRLKEV